MSLEVTTVKTDSARSAGGGARTHTALRPLDFESSASANSATPALGGKTIRNSRISSTSSRCRVRCPQRIFRSRESKQSADEQRTLQKIECLQTTRWSQNFTEED